MTRLKDIASELGYSPATISRALSNPALVSDDKRKRIEEAIARLDYRPNLMARNLRRRSTQLVLVVFPQLGPFFLGVFTGIEEAAKQLGYTAVAGHSGNDANRERVLVDQMLGRIADGAILVATGDGTLLARERQDLPPLVTMLDTVETSSLPTVRVDNRAAAYAATSHLIALGHRRLAHISGSPQRAFSRHRLAGFDDAVAEAGIDPRHCYRVTGDFNVTSGIEAAERLLTRHPPPTAIFAANDEIAVGVMQVLKRNNIVIGRDISVVGFDDQRIASVYEPQLTTVHVPMAQMGYEAMMLLHRAIGGEDVTGTDIVLPTHLVERATTGPAPR